MSSLWTPGGEVPVDRNREGTTPPPGSPSTDAPREQSAEAGADEGALRERAEAIRQMMLQAPAADIVAQHAVGLIELAALHLSQESPRLDDARLAIDAASALVEGVGDRLGPAGAELQTGANQLKMAYVEIADSVSSGGDD